ncbi:MAG: dihydroneopterin aldolase [Salibacteraceae bacterium]
MARLTINGLEFFAYHGCHELERKTGGPFKVDVLVDGDFDAAEQTDDVDQAMDYVTIMDLVEDQMLVRCNLIETVAKNIAVSIAGHFPQASRVEAIVYKMKVPLKHTSAYVSVNHTIEQNMDN